MELEKQSWEALGSQIKEADPKLGAIIDEISPSDDYGIYRVKYPYGAIILDKGTFQIPNSQNLIVPLNHASIPNKIKEDLSYTGTMPTGIIIENSIETYFSSANRTIPASLYGKGDIVSLWCVLEEGTSYHKGSLWNISSGARTIFMLPKITDKNGFKNLKQKYELKSPIPRMLNDHWEIFAHLSSNKHFRNKWLSTICLFGKKWFEHREDKKWSEFYRYLLNKVWQESSFRRNQFIFDHTFSVAQENRNLKPNPYIADTVRHLIAIGSGALPGFAPAVDESAAPITGLQEIFLNDYELKKYAPIIMHLHHFSRSIGRSVYYSLDLPTTMVFSPRSSRISSKMVDMRELKHILEVLVAEILKENLNIQQTPLFELAKNIKYDFYHSEKDQLSEIMNVISLANLDPSFSKTISNPERYCFPEFSSFFRGCVSVSCSR